MGEIKENNSSTPKSANSATDKEKRQPKKNGFLQKATRQVLLAVLFLAIGAGLVFFLVYRPVAKEYAIQQEEITRLQGIELQYNDLLVNYADLNTRHEVAVTLVDIYKIQNNVNIARIALMGENETRLSIALGYVEKDIDALNSSAFPEKIDLSSRVDAIQTYLPDDPQQALQELGALFDDLLLLANNLEITE